MSRILLLHPWQLDRLTGLRPDQIRHYEATGELVRCTIADQLRYRWVDTARLVRKASPKAADRIEEALLPLHDAARRISADDLSPAERAEQINRQVAAVTHASKIVTTAALLYGSIR